MLPKTVREAHGWREGLELTIEDMPDGVRLRTAKPYPPTTLDEVAGCLRYAGRPKTLKEMEEGVLAEAKRRHARGRYYCHRTVDHRG